MKYYFLLVLSICLLAPNPTYSQKFSDEGLQLYWTVMQSLESGETPSIDEWKALWESPGYNHWMDSDRGQRIFHKYYTLVHSPALEDSLQKDLAKSEGYRLSIFNHLIEAKQKRRKIRKFARKLMASDIIDQARTIALQYFPPAFDQVIAHDSSEIALMLFIPDAFAHEGAVLFDALYAYNYGKGLEYFLAHELHHTYLSKYLSKLKMPPEDDQYFPLIMSIDNLRLEGVADLIDKSKILEKSNPSHYEIEYCKHYQNSRRHLEKIDSLLLAISKDNSLIEECGKQIRRELPYSAHPTGLYIGHRIEMYRGRKGILACLENPFVFLQMYNEIAIQFPEEHHVFSEGAMDYLSELEEQFIEP